MSQIFHLGDTFCFMKTGGGHVKFYPHEKGGGGGKSFSHAEGGAQKVSG